MKKSTKFGKLLKDHRVDNGLKEKDLADKVEKSQSYISGVEAGKILLDYGFLKDCIKVFDLQGTEKHKFLEDAMFSSKKMTIPFSDIPSDMRERFLILLAHILLYDPPPEGNDDREPWIIQAIVALMGHINYEKESKTKMS